ncbi:MAG: Flp pilus assembly protein CpaB [Firmicutes bacterium HGW-Firmicutes-15]|nr:MAG: Flp pilus assembly protein CpaB [Firmicutes bacterium HGW-Firmicutes-15]
MLKGSRKYWVIAIICGLAASFLSYRYLQDIKIRYSPDDLVPVVIAKVTINKDTPIKAEQLKVENLPGKYVHPDALHNIKDVAGKIATTSIIASEEILGPKLLSSADKANRLAYMIPGSKRAVSIPVNEISGVAGFIKVGDRVDIIATIDLPSVSLQGAEKMSAYSILTLQDIEVLAIGENPEILDKKNPGGGKTLTLAVSLQEAQPLVLASERGNLRVLLRSPVDQSRTNLAPFQLNNFLVYSGAPN